MKQPFCLVAALWLASPPGASAAQYAIAIQDMKFGPAPQGLKVGDTITWTNRDILRHTATARTGAFDLKLEPGKSASVRLAKAGPITVFCRYHPDMTLQLAVAK